MRGGRFLASIVGMALVAACGGSGETASAGTNAASRGETFTYTPAQDRNLRITVDEVRLRGSAGYLPKDPNWVQLRLTVANVGSRMVQFGNVRTRLENGTVLASAVGSSDLAKPPSVGGTMGRTLGLGVAGQVAGTMIFPPLALLANGASLLGMTGGMNSWKKRTERIDAGLLHAQELAPGTRISGDVYIPAVRGQTALIAFYAIEGRSQSLTIQRAP